MFANFAFFVKKRIHEFTQVPNRQLPATQTNCRFSQSNSYWFLSPPFTLCFIGESAAFSNWSGKEYEDWRWYRSSTFLALNSKSFFCNDSVFAFTPFSDTSCFVCFRMKFNCSCRTNRSLYIFFRVVSGARFSILGCRIQQFLNKKQSWDKIFS